MTTAPLSPPVTSPRSSAGRTQRRPVHLAGSVCGASAWVWGTLRQPADDERQDGLEDLVVIDVWQIHAGLPDMRVVRAIYGQVRAGPCSYVLLLQALVQGEER